MCNSQIQQSLIMIEKHNRDERREIMAELQRGHENILNLVQNFSKLSEENIRLKFASDEPDYITYNDLMNVKLDVWNVLEGKGIRFMRKYHPEKECFFITEMIPEKGIKPNQGLMFAEFGLQVHNCKEIGRVIKGHLIELVETGKEYMVGDTFIYPRNFKHKPIATVKSVYEVEFINPKK